MRHIVDEHRAGAALGAVASELGAGQPQLVAQRRGQRFLLQHVDAPLLAVDVSVISRSTLPGADGCWPSTDDERHRYAAEDTAAPDAMTPLMKLRRETFLGVSSVIVLSSMDRPPY